MIRQTNKNEVKEKMKMLHRKNISRYEYVTLSCYLYDIKFVYLLHIKILIHFTSHNKIILIVSLEMKFFFKTVLSKNRK